MDEVTCVCDHQAQYRQAMVTMHGTTDDDLYEFAATGGPLLDNSLEAASKNVITRESLDELFKLVHDEMNYPLRPNEGLLL